MQQDEDLVVLDELGIDIEDMLDHINASCGAPGCLSHSSLEEEDD
jgi:hypothetical protein